MNQFIILMVCTSFCGKILKMHFVDDYNGDSDGDNDCDGDDNPATITSSL